VRQEEVKEHSSLGVRRASLVWVQEVLGKRVYTLDQSLMRGGTEMNPE